MTNKENSGTVPESRLNLAITGGIGAVAPDILLLYSKRWTMPDITFSLELYLVATLMYVLLAGFVASIFPYGKLARGKNSLWVAFGIGVCLPIVIAGVTTIFKSEPVATRGEASVGRFVDLIAF
ncbi:hypothetical protein [Spirosoma validum]|uniref:Uncharacterized protein n=1 Tax=Spirosoma validum TaxID=2771355 RepID=A0A927B9T9_9BACT|nr:hypothetical protein [Spirosoma validum]MBD2757863.1 hypothetical protein [Spirosoma validum]